jgi:hypothetical protein
MLKDLLSFSHLDTIRIYIWYWADSNDYKQLFGAKLVKDRGNQVL